MNKWDFNVAKKLYNEEFVKENCEWWTLWREWYKERRNLK
jgi:hypothetical protein